MSDIERTDLSEIIEIASLKLAEDQDRLTEAQVDEIAAELGIPREYVDDAQAILQEQRQAEAAEETQREATRRTLVWVGLGIAGLCALASMVGYNSLNATLALVDQQHAQVVNVMERQAETKTRLADHPHSSSKAAELAGAENRVRIERKRYDEEAASYNRKAASFPNSLWRGLFGLPSARPLSNDDAFKAESGNQ